MLFAAKSDKTIKIKRQKQKNDKQDLLMKMPQNSHS